MKQPKKSHKKPKKWKMPVLSEREEQKVLEQIDEIRGK